MCGLLPQERHIPERLRSGVQQRLYQLRKMCQALSRRRTFHGVTVMRTIQCDVVVVGAGPGGSMAAKYCAEGGLDTILIEKKAEIGAPLNQ